MEEVVVRLAAIHLEAVDQVGGGVVDGHRGEGAAEDGGAVGVDRRVVH